MKQTIFTARLSTAQGSGFTLYAGPDGNRAESLFLDAELGAGDYVELESAQCEVEFLGDADELEDYPFAQYHNDKDLWAIDMEAEWHTLATRKYRSDRDLFDAHMVAVTDAADQAFGAHSNIKYYNTVAASGKSVKLRIADHGWNHFRNNVEGEADFFMSVVLGVVDSFGHNEGDDYAQFFLPSTSEPQQVVAFIQSKLSKI